MVQGIVIVFLVFAVLFAFVHAVATAASLYWYYWWFDEVMHFWGGTLLGLGVHALSTFTCFHVRPNLKTILITLAVFTGAWEVFEWYVDLWLPQGYVFDTIKDVTLGFTGGLLAHSILRKYTTRS